MPLIVMIRLISPGSGFSEGQGHSPYETCGWSSQAFPLLRSEEKNPEGIGCWKGGTGCVQNQSSAVIRMFSCFFMWISIFFRAVRPWSARKPDELQDFIAGQETDITGFDETLVKKLIEHHSLCRPLHRGIQVRHHNRNRSIKRLLATELNQ